MEDLTFNDEINYLSADKIDGFKESLGSGKKVKSINPSNLEEIAEFELTDITKIGKLIRRSNDAFNIWSKFNYDQRAESCENLRKIIVENAEDIAKIISQDTGKPILEALVFEVYPAIEIIKFYAKNTKKILKTKRINIGIFKYFGRSSSIAYDPYGSIAIFSAINFPFIGIICQAIPALMAGNSVIHKPGSPTFYTAFETEKLFLKANFCENVFQTLYGKSSEGLRLIEQGNVSKLFYAGNADFGKKLMKACAENVIPVNVQFGGKDPAIVLDDANIKHAAAGITWGALTNSGQVCASIERVYVHDSVAEKFTNEVLKIVSKLKQGNPLDSDTDLGPMMSDFQINHVKEHIKDAKNNNAEFLSGGEENKDLEGYYYLPTVLQKVYKQFKCINEKTHGPLIPIMTFSSEDEVIKKANNSKYGLSASIWTKNINRAKSIGSRINVHAVMINETIYSRGISQVPWGGRKASGYGINHGVRGLLEMVQIKHFHINYVTLLKNFWWFKYDTKIFSLFLKFLVNYNGKLMQKLKSYNYLFRLIINRKNW
ncbi:MAG: aldehyde dehydrogenase family protein [Pseudomonadota bacterium]